MPSVCRPQDNPQGAEQAEQAEPGSPENTEANAHEHQPEQEASLCVLLCLVIFFVSNDAT